MKRKRYGEYVQTIRGKLHAVVYLRQPDGSYKRKYKQVPDKLTGQQWALATLDKHKKGQTYDDSITFEEFADWYKEEFLHAPRYEKGLKVDGVKDYERLKNKVDRMKEFFGSRKMSEFSELDLRRWQKSRTVLTATINRDLALLRTMFKRGIKYKKILTMPEFDINTSAETERDRVLTFEEEKRLLAACAGEETIKVKSRSGKEYTMTIAAKREHLRTVIILAVDTAMRLNEIFTLTWNDVDLENGVITVRATNTKTQTSRKTMITPRVREELEKIKGTGKVFNQKSPKRAFMTACARARIEDLHFHDLRHTAITRMIRAGIPYAEVMKMSGHRTMKTFLRYLNIKDDAVVAAADKLAQFYESQK